MIIGSLGSNHTLRQEGNVFCWLRPPTIALPSWRRARTVLGVICKHRLPGLGRVRSWASFCKHRPPGGGRVRSRASFYKHRPPDGGARSLRNVQSPDSPPFRVWEAPEVRGLYPPLERLVFPHPERVGDS
jgi:hypothetical protein